MRNRLHVVAAAALPLVLVPVLASPAAARATGWPWPIEGDVLTPFRLPAAPFAAGGHRGIDIAARAGARVRAVCPGRVTFAGSLAGGSAVTVRCGALAVTYLHLGALTVRRGVAVRTGTALGAVGARGGPPLPGIPHLHLGIRRAADRRGYLDPLGLLRSVGAHERPPLGPAPRPGTARRPRAAAPIRKPRLSPRAVPAPAATPGPGPAAWAGLGLLASGLPLGALAGRRRRRRRRGAPPALAEERP